MFPLYSQSQEAEPDTSGDALLTGLEPVFPSEAESKTKKSKEASSAFFGRNRWFCTDLGSFLLNIPEDEIKLGASFEHKVTNHAGLKGGLSYDYSNPEEEISAHDLGFMAEAAWYPAGMGLEKFHIGAGFNADCIFYRQDSFCLDKDWIVGLYPLIGWKQNFDNFAAADFSVGYRFLLNTPNETTLLYEKYESGPVVKLNFLINWKKLIETFR